MNLFLSSLSSKTCFLLWFLATTQGFCLSVLFYLWTYYVITACFIIYFPLPKMRWIIAFCPVRPAWFSVDHRGCWAQAGGGVNPAHAPWHDRSLLDTLSLLHYCGSCNEQCNNERASISWARLRPLQPSPGPALPLSKAPHPRWQHVLSVLYPACHQDDYFNKGCIKSNVGVCVSFQALLH